MDDLASCLGSNIFGLFCQIRIFFLFSFFCNVLGWGFFSSLCRSFCLFSLSFCVCLCLLVSLSVRLSIYPFIHFSFSSSYCSFYLFSYLCMCLSFYLSVCPSIHLSIFPSFSLCLPNSLFLSKGLGRKEGEGRPDGRGRGRKGGGEETKSVGRGSLNLLELDFITRVCGCGREVKRSHSHLLWLPLSPSLCPPTLTPSLISTHFTTLRSVYGGKGEEEED